MQDVPYGAPSAQQKPSGQDSRASTLHGRPQNLLQIKSDWQATLGLVGYREHGSPSRAEPTSSHQRTSGPSSTVRKVLHTCPSSHWRSVEHALATQNAR